MGLRNPVGITTKLRLRDTDLAHFRSLRHLRLVVFVSLALLPRRLEPVPVAPRIDNLHRLSAAQIPTVLYLRPIIEGVNDGRDTLKRLLVLADAYCDAVCIGGLRISPEIAANLAAAGEPPQSEPLRAFHDKPVPPRAVEVIEALRVEHRLSVPIYK